MLPLQVSAQIPFVESVHPDKSMTIAEAEHSSQQTGKPFFASEASIWYDVSYYKLQLLVETDPSLLRGAITVLGKCTATSDTALTLDLRNTMTVDSVTMNGSAVSFVQRENAFDITLDRIYNTGELLSVVIYYHGIPVETGFGSFLFASHNSVPWVWTLSEPAGARDWWPCKDDPSDKADSADIVVTCNSSFKVGSEGILLSLTDNGDGTHTYHWHESYPIASYLISFALTDFKEYRQYFKYSPTDSMPIINYLLPEHFGDAVSALQGVPDMLAIYSKLFGLYPFITEKYGHSEFGKGGAMEHQTMTSTTTFEENTISHELAHQWFGDMITCRTWNDLWVNEGIAQYCSALFLEFEYGIDAYSNFINQNRIDALKAEGAIAVADTTSVRNLFDYSRIYQKGSFVLHMLRHVLGDSVFFRSMKAYAGDPQYRYGTATIDDFQAVCEQKSGRDLSWFFSEWFHGVGYPEYVYSWNYTTTDTGINFSIDISQKEGTNPHFYTMPIDIRISGSGWDTTVTVFNNLLEQHFTVNLSRIPERVKFDPDNFILKQAFDNSNIPPTAYSLGQNYPNPFNATTTIHYFIPKRSRVSLKVFDVLGREVTTLVSADNFAGTYAVTWDASTIASGVYFYRLMSDSYSATKKMILLR